MVKLFQISEVYNFQNEQKNYARKYYEFAEYWWGNKVA